MSTKAITGFVIVIIIVGVGAFFGGSAYGKTQAAASRASQFAQTSRSGGRAGGQMAGGVTSGSVLSVSSTNLTVSLRNGSTQIVLLSPSTAIMKAVSGSTSDLTSGQQITVIGTSNSDGSLTAQSIQIRPSTTTPPVAQQ